MSSNLVSAAPGVVRPIDRALSVWTLLIATSINEAILLILPSFVGALGDDLHLSAARVGLLGSSDLVGIALSTATGPWWVRRVVFGGHRVFAPDGLAFRRGLDCGGWLYDRAGRCDGYEPAGPQCGSVAGGAGCVFRIGSLRDRCGSGGVAARLCLLLSHGVDSAVCRACLAALSRGAGRARAVGLCGLASGGGTGGRGDRRRWDLLSDDRCGLGIPGGYRERGWALTPPDGSGVESWAGGEPH